MASMSLTFTAELRNTSATSASCRSSVRARRAPAWRTSPRRRLSGPECPTHWSRRKPCWQRSAGTWPWSPSRDDRAAVEWCEGQCRLRASERQRHAARNGLSHELRQARATVTSRQSNPHGVSGDRLVGEIARKQPLPVLCSAAMSNSAMLWTPACLVQFLAQSPLPEMSVAGPCSVARGPPIRTADDALFPRGLDLARRERRNRLAEQGGRVRHLFHAAAEILRTIGADPKHLGGELGFLPCSLPGDRCCFISAPAVCRRRRWARCRLHPMDRLPTERAFDADILAFFGALARHSVTAAPFLHHLSPARKTQCRVDGEVAVPIPGHRRRCPPPVPTERGVQISRTTVFRR
jgi:hypothetical protein